ncbi:MAG: trypsin-like peptidase domain-containing protein [Anaerolineales bacterium]
MILEFNTESARLSKQVHASLVRVESGRWGAGAGTIWHSEGLILTNSHVARSRRLRVTLPDGRRAAARVLARSRDLDLAALTVGLSDLPVIELGDSAALQPGHWVMAFGHPWGVAGAATAGVVIGQGAEFPGRPAFGRDWLAVGLHYRPGHSGGPLVDSSGRLVGINTVMVGPDVGLAVPVHEVKGFLKHSLQRAAA